MNDVMSKILSLGVPFEEIIRMSTVNPADEIRRLFPRGRLSVGAEADVAVLRRERGQFGFVDSRGQRRAGTERITSDLTLRAGRAVWELNGRAAR